MKKRMFSNLALSLSLIGCIGLFSVLSSNKVLASIPQQLDYDKVTSPDLYCYAIGNLRNDDGVVSTKISASKLNNQISFYIDNFPELQEDEVFFAVFIDRRKGIYGKKYLEPMSGGAYGCSYDMPYHCCMTDIHIYKQKISDPAFLIKPENFIGRSNFLMASDSIFYRPEGYAQITTYDENNNVVSDMGEPSAHLSRITPNYYSLELDFGDDLDYAEIILPEGKENLLTKEEKNIQPKYYTLDAESEENVVWSGKNCLDFYLPNGINEFRVKYTRVLEDGQKKIYNFYIKLNKE